MNNQENNIFIEHLKSGDEKGYAYLVKTYYKRLFIYALGLTRNEKDAEDIVQNVFLAIWRKRASLNSAKSIKSLLYKSVYNEFIDQYRKKGRLQNIATAYYDSLNYVVSDENQDSLKNMLSIVEEGIEKLPKRCKETFLLSKKEGLNNREIADYMGTSIKTVEVQITKAFKILRKELKDKIKPVLFILTGLLRRQRM